MIRAAIRSGARRLRLPAGMGERVRRLAGRLWPSQTGKPSAPARSQGPRTPLGVRLAAAGGLGLFCLVLALVMLAAKFPDERLRVWIERTLTPGYGMSLAAGSVRTTLFPPGAEVSDLRLRLEGTAEPLARMPLAVVRLDLAAACLGRLAVSASGETLGGQATLAAASDSLFGGGWEKVSVSASRLDLERSPGLAWLVGRHAGGRLSGQYDFVPGKADSGRLGVLVEDGFIEVEGEMLRTVRVELGRMAVRGTSAPGGLAVAECSLASAMLKGSLSGRIDSPGPGGDIRASRLDLAGTLADEVQAQVTPVQPAKVRFGGTLAAPTVTWGTP